MAGSSTLSSALSLLPPFNSNVSSKSKPSLFFPFHLKPMISLCSSAPLFKAFAAPELAESPETLSVSEVPAGLEVEGSELSVLAVDSDSDKMAGAWGSEPPRRPFNFRNIFRSKKTLSRWVDRTEEYTQTSSPMDEETTGSDDASLPPHQFTPHIHSYAGPSTQSHGDRRIYIEQEGETFIPHQEPTHMIRDIIMSKYDAPYLSWKKIPQEVRDMWFREFERSFRWLPQNHQLIRRNFERRGSDRLGDMFTAIRKVEKRPYWIGESVWRDLDAAWNSPDYKRKRMQAKINRASDADGARSSRHTGGSVPHTEIRRRLMKMLGQEPTAVELHAYTHQRKVDQSWIDSRSKNAYDEYENLRSQSQQEDAGEGTSGTHDYSLWVKEVGGKKKGNIYGLGSHGKTYEVPTAYSTRPGSGGETMEEMQQRHIREMEEMRSGMTQFETMHRRMTEMQSEMEALRRRLDEVDRGKARQEAEDEDVHSKSD